MKIIKYILFIALLFTLWVTKPLWIPVKSYTDTTVSPVDIQIKEQQTQRNTRIAAEDKKLKELESKFGKKPVGKYGTHVPLAVEEYWNKTLSNPASLEEERCSPIKASIDGWVTVCRYRAKDRSGTLILRQDAYTIKNGTVVK